MITKNMQDKIRFLRRLRVENTDKTRYRFDSNTSTLYIPTIETNFSKMFQDCTKLETIMFSINSDPVHTIKACALQECQGSTD